MEKQKEHKLTESRPVLSAILWILAGFLGSQLIGGSLDAVVGALVWPYPSGLGVITILVAFLILGIFRRRYAPEFEGNLRGGQPRLGLRLAVPLIIYWIITTVILFLVSPESMGIPGLHALLLAFVAGVTEETAFRGLGIACLLRQWKDEKGAVRAVVLTAVLFGAIHLSNVVAGADLLTSFLQSIAAGCTGLLLGAIYVRTGSLWPPMIIHTLHDIIAFCNVGAVHDGVLVGEIGWYSWLDLALTALLGLAGLYMLRREKRREICMVWDRKWNRQDTVSRAVPGMYLSNN